MTRNDFDRRLLGALVVCSALAVFFYGATIISTRSIGAWYLLLNLLLAYIPLLLTFPLLGAVRKHGWQDLRSVAWGLAWLGFLPNSFYLVTDFIHLLERSYGLDPLFGVILFGLFGFVGMSIGFVCVYSVHRALLDRFGQMVAYGVVEIILLLTSIGICLGRTLRWNTWDAVLHPVAVAEAVIGVFFLPVSQGPGMIGMFFVLLSGLYAAVHVAWGKL